MKLTNLEIKRLQERLQDIIQNIYANMDIISNEEISITFLQPIMRVATEISDKIFIQTDEKENKIKTNFEEFEIEKILNKKVEVIKNQFNCFGLQYLRHKISDKAEKVEQINNLFFITKTKKQITIMTATEKEKDEIAEKAAVSVTDFGFDVFLIKKGYEEDDVNGTYMYTYEFFINC